MNFSERVVSRLKRADLKTVSLHNPLSSENSNDLNELLPDEKTAAPDKVIDTNERQQRLNQLLDSLDERERSILLMRYGLDGKPPKTLEEVSKQIGRTRERVRQIQKRALSKLRYVMKNENGSNIIGMN